MRLLRDADLVVVDGFLGALLDRLIDHVLHDRGAIKALDVAGWSLAGTETLQIDLRSRLGDLRLELGGQIILADRDLVHAAQAFRLGFADFHFLIR